MTRDPVLTARFQRVVADVLGAPLEGAAPDEQWTPDGTCDSTCALLDEDGSVYDAFPDAELISWGDDHPWRDGHCYFRLPDGTLLDPTVYQFTREPDDWFGAAYRVRSAS